MDCYLLEGDFLSIRREDFPPEQIAGIEAEAKRLRITFAAAVRVILDRGLFAGLQYQAQLRPETGPKQALLKEEEGAQNRPVSGPFQTANEPAPPARVENSSPEGNSEKKKPRKRDEFLDAAWALYDEVEAPRPPAGLLKKWLREFCKSKPEWMLGILRDISVRGALGKGDAYVAGSLKRATVSGEPPQAPRPPLYDSPEEKAAWEAGEQARKSGLAAVYLEDEDFTDQAAEIKRRRTEAFARAAAERSKGNGAQG